MEQGQVRCSVYNLSVSICLPCSLPLSRFISFRNMVIRNIKKKKGKWRSKSNLSVEVAYMTQVPIQHIRLSVALGMDSDWETIIPEASGYLQYWVDSGCPLTGRERAISEGFSPFSPNAVSAHDKHVLASPLSRQLAPTTWPSV